MNWNELEGNWAEFSKKAHSNWSKLTAEQLSNVNGRRTELAQLIQTSYQCSIGDAESQIDVWLGNLLGSDKSVSDNNLDQKLKDNQDSPDTIVEKDEIVGSPYHKGY